MDKPEIAATCPVSLELEPGKYFWCACGRSKDQPFCDGSHSGTTFEPLEIVVDEKKPIYFCQCKKTARPPFCDGAHKTIPAE